LLFWKSNPEKQLQSCWLKEASISRRQTLDSNNINDNIHPDDWQQRLELAVHTTLEAYTCKLLESLNGSGICMALDPDFLQEPPNIAHSAFVLLIATNVQKLGLPLPKNSCNDISQVLDGLTRGIFSMQREDGAFCITFGGGVEDDNVYPGIEFYPGEAMVALMEVYELSMTSSTDFHNKLISDNTRDAILPAMSRAFEFYSKLYEKGEMDVNYSIWQVQAFARLYDALTKTKDNSNADDEATLVANYVLNMCQDIVSSRSWKELYRGKSFYPNLQTVEIACGLDALTQGIRIASERGQKEDDLLLLETRLLQLHANNAVDFLRHVQNLVPKDQVVGFGGLGFGGVQVFEQRLDVTGHAISALTKMHRLATTS
jgi:hypothetical protein